VYRRQYLRAAAVVAGTGGVAAVSARDAARRADASSGQPDTPTATDTTATGTPTATPTEPAATPTSGWEPMGAVTVPGAAETVVAPGGETAFVATGDGFAVLDLSDPADPTVRTRVGPVSPPGTDRVMPEIRDVKYDDGHLLVAGPASYHPDGYRGVARYDVRDPGAPAFVRAYETAFAVHNCYFADDVAYLTGRDNDRHPLVVVDVGPEPTEVARWSVLDHDEDWAEVDHSVRRIHDVWVQDGYAYLAYWDAGTWILDVSDPSDPRYVANVTDRPIEELANDTGLKIFREFSEPPGNDHYVATSPDGALMAVGQESWNSNAGVDETTPTGDDPGGPSGIELYDITDRTSPERVATIDPPPTADPNFNGVMTTAHNFQVGEQYLYSSWYQGGVKVHDVSDPTEPEEVRHFRRSSTTSFWTAQLSAPGEAVVATSYLNPQDLEAPGVVYTFPDVPRPTPTPSPTPTAGSTDASTPTAAPTPNPTSAADPSPTPGATTGAGPGFGPLAALAALGVGTWLLGGDE